MLFVIPQENQQQNQPKKEPRKKTQATKPNKKNLPAPPSKKTFIVHEKNYYMTQTEVNHC